MLNGKHIRKHNKMNGGEKNECSNSDRNEYANGL